MTNAEIILTIYGAVVSVLFILYTYSTVVVERARNEKAELAMDHYQWRGDSVARLGHIIQRNQVRIQKLKKEVRQLKESKASWKRLCDERDDYIKELDRRLLSHDKSIGALVRMLREVAGKMHPSYDAECNNVMDLLRDFEWVQQ